MRFYLGYWVKLLLLLIFYYVRDLGTSKPWLIEGSTCSSLRLKINTCHLIRNVICACWMWTLIIYQTFHYICKCASSCIELTVALTESSCVGAKHSKLLFGCNRPLPLTTRVIRCSNSRGLSSKGMLISRFISITSAYLTFHNMEADEILIRSPNSWIVGRVFIVLHVIFKTKNLLTESVFS